MRRLEIDNCYVDVGRDERTEDDRVRLILVGVERLRLSRAEAFRLAAALLIESGHEVVIGAEHPTVGDVLPPMLTARVPPGRARGRYS